MAEVGYRSLHETGELKKRAELSWALLEDCTVCPQQCHVDRLHGETGFCQTGSRPLVSSYGPHFGEEMPLVGTRGSGTIFITNCNMRCIFCQNYPISQCGQGTEVSCDTLARIMLNLQQTGCHNINFVSPSHIVPQIIQAVDTAASNGLSIPLVYNSGGYDSTQTLSLLDGVVDIYMPDAKYGRDDVAWELSHAAHYVESMHSALKEMHRQVGDLALQDGIAVRGMIIRHLVLPHNLASSEEIMPFIADDLSKNSYVNIMDQYTFRRTLPSFTVDEMPLLKLIRRGITEEEYRYAVACARAVGLHRGIPDLCGYR